MIRIAITEAAFKAIALAIAATLPVGSVGYEGGPNQNFTLEIGTAVPEPSTWAMMALGFGVLGPLRYRKTRRDAA